MYYIDEPDFWYWMTILIGELMKFSQPEPLSPSGHLAPIPLATRLKRVGKIGLWIVGIIFALPVVFFLGLCLAAILKSAIPII